MMPSKKFDYVNLLNAIEEKNNRKFIYDGNLNSHTSVSCDCIVNDCQKKCKRIVRDLLKDELVLCTSHLTENRLKNDYGTKDECIERVKNNILEHGIEIVTTDGLKKLGLLKHINHHKISVEDLQTLFEYKKILLEKNYDQLKETVKKLVDNNGAKVLFWSWLKDNTERNFFKKLKYASSKNENLLLKRLAVEFQVEFEWNKIYKENHAEKTSSTATRRNLKKLNCFLKEFKKMYNERGIFVFNATWLEENYHDMYRCFRNNNMSLEKLASKFGILDEYNKKYRDSITKNSGRIVRTEEKMYELAIEILSMWGFIPCAEILRENGFGNFISIMYQFGKNFHNLNKEFGIDIKQTLTTVTGELLNSQSEVCFVNFLHSRGVEQYKGEKYANDYNELYERGGLYDRQFVGKNGIYENKLIYVEIWGGPKNRLKQEQYNNKRKEKENYHKNKSGLLFLGIEHEDCYSEGRLEEILKPYIGIISPFNFRNKAESKISCVKWHLFHDIKKGCEHIYKYNNNLLPSITWMRRDDVRCDWEMSENFDIKTFSYKIDRFGGIKKVREYMDSLIENCDEMRIDV